MRVNLRCFKKKKAAKPPPVIDTEFVNLNPMDVLQYPTYEERDDKQFHLLEGHKQHELNVLLDLSTCKFGYSDFRYYLHFCKLVKQRYKNRLKKLVVFCPRGVNRLFANMLMSVMGKKTSGKIEIVDHIENKSSDKLGSTPNWLRLLSIPLVFYIPKPLLCLSFIFNNLAN